MVKINNRDMGLITEYDYNECMVKAFVDTLKRHNVYAEFRKSYTTIALRSKEFANSGLGHHIIGEVFHPVYYDTDQTPFSLLIRLANWAYMYGIIESRTKDEIDYHLLRITSIMEQLKVVDIEPYRGGGMFGLILRHRDKYYNWSPIFRNTDEYLPECVIKREHNGWY